jgi:hypothetical protein
VVTGGEDTDKVEQDYISHAAASPLDRIVEDDFFDNTLDTCITPSKDLLLRRKVLIPVSRE